MPELPPMKIGYVYPFEANPPRGGNRLHAYQLIRGFLARGHQVSTLGDASMENVRCFPSTSEGARALLEAVQVLYVRIDANYLTQAPLIVTLLEEATIPVVWEINAPANEGLAFSWLGGRRSPEGFLAEWGDRLRRTLHAARQKPGIRKEESLRSRLASNVGAAICVSEPLGRYARQELGLDTVKVLPNGSDPELNHPDREPFPLPQRYEGRLKALFAGSPIYPWQGLDLLLEAAATTDESIVYLLLVNQPLGQSTPENVLVLESVPYGDVGRYICAADVCLALQPDFPWSPWGFHCSPMKVFDYMACGRPILTTRVGQPSDVVRFYGNGLICERNPREVRENLRYLASHPAEARCMGKRSRRAVVERYNWDHIVDETLGLLHELEEAR